METFKRPRFGERARRPHQSGWLTGRERLRLVTMFMSLCMVIAFMRMVQKPGSLDWFINLGAQPKAKVADTSSLQPSFQIAPFVQEPAVPINAVAAQRRPDPRLLLADECKEVNTAYLEPIRDKTPPGAADRDAIYHLLCVAATANPADLTAKARKDVLFANLFNDPALYRGRPIRIRGTLARLARWENKQDANPHGIPSYYEAWVFPEDQRVNPCLIMAGKIPADMTPGMDHREAVEIDAYFLKLQVYHTTEGIERAAPLLVGNALRRHRPSMPYATFDIQKVLLTVGLVTLILGAVAVARSYVNKDRELNRDLRSVADMPEFTSDVEPPKSSPHTPCADEHGTQNVPATVAAENPFGIPPEVEERLR